MNTTKICHIPVTGPVFLSFLFILLIMRGSSEATVSTPAERINVLSRSIDSLDILKQELKRNGRPISELERSQTIMRDSLSILHNVMQKASKQPMRTDKPASSRPDTFDWIIIFVGIVALFSGLIFIAGTLRSPTKRRKRALQTAAAAPQGISYPLRNIKETTVGAAYPEYQTSVPADTPAAGTDYAALSGATESGWKNLPGIQYGNRQPEAAPQAAARSPLNEAEQEEKETVESRVLKASRSGLDIQAISRKFHLSTDHVALIIKMAESSHGGRNRF